VDLRPKDPAFGIASPLASDDDPRMNKIMTQVALEKLPDVSAVTTSAASGDDASNHQKFQYVALIGFPSDEGTLRNGGVAGGYQGPSAFRFYLKKKGTIFNNETKEDISHMRIVDLGDVIEPYSGEEHQNLRSFKLDEPQDENVKAVLDAALTWDSLTSPPKLNDSGYRLEEAHLRLEGFALRALMLGYHPFCIGGSNDQSYPNAHAALRYLRNQSALQNSKPRPLCVINIDAHLDVRPLLHGSRAHSGSPFRQLLQTEGFEGKHFVEFAAQGGQCSRNHAEYVESKGGRIYWLDQLRESARSQGLTVPQQFANVLDSFPSDAAIFVSFDIDSVKGCDAPGVSCPSPVGLEAWEAIEMAHTAGAHPRVILFDLSELCPKVEKDRTPLLATFMFYAYIRGRSKLGQRK